MLLLLLRLLLLRLLRADRRCVYRCCSCSSACGRQLRPPKLNAAKAPVSVARAAIDGQCDVSSANMAITTA